MPSPRIAYLDGPRLRRTLVAACDHAQRQRGELNRINVFPVPDGDTGTNLALTVVTLTTSLLIVMGFSVPAAIASRRIRERWLAEDQIRYLAMHDSLTGLPNRLQLHQHLDRAVARAKRHGRLMAVFGLDLDRFKDVNDTLGHATGDALLAEVSARLRESVRESDMVGRLGGDEFAIVAEDLEAPEDAMRLARRVYTALGEPYQANGHEVTTWPVSASMLRKWGCDQVQGFYYSKPEADVARVRRVRRQTTPSRL